MNPFWKADIEFLCPVRQEARRSGSATIHQTSSIRLNQVYPGQNLEVRNFSCDAYSPSVCQDGCNHEGHCPAFRVLKKFIAKADTASGYCDFIHAVESIPLAKYHSEIKTMDRGWWQQTREACEIAERQIKYAVKGLRAMQAS